MVSPNSLGLQCRLLSLLPVALILLSACGTDRYDGSRYEQLSASDLRFGGQGVAGVEKMRSSDVGGTSRQSGSTTRTAPRQQTDFVWTPQVSPEGKVTIDVSLARQQISVYRNGTLIGRSPVSTGRAGKESPPGQYTILGKNATHRSNLYGSHVDVNSGRTIQSAKASDPVPMGARYVPASMPYMQRLTYDGIALHAGDLPGYPASAGCIRMPRGFAERLFTVTTVGDEVSIF